MSRRALVVGIGKYPHPNGLENPVNDAVAIRSRLLVGFGFKTRDVVMLLDERATMERIRDRLDWLITGAKAGDEVVFYFSGHGAQVPDLDGDETVDHQDEILCPVDFDDHWDDPLTDDDLRDVFLGLAKGARLTVILDCCHSGAATRGIKDQYSPRRIIPPKDILMRAEGMALPTNRIGVRQLPGYIAVSPTMNHILVAACREGQTASDGTGDHGAFTDAFLEVVKPASAHTWVDQISAISALLQSWGYEQRPQLEGPVILINGYPFGGT